MKIKVKKRGGRGGPELKYLSTCSFLFLGPQQSRSAETLPEPELRLHKTLLFPLLRLHNFFFPPLTLLLPKFLRHHILVQNLQAGGCQNTSLGISQPPCLLPHWGSLWSVGLSMLQKILVLHYKSPTGQKVSCLTSLFCDKNVKVIIPSAGFLCLPSPSPSTF